MAAGWYPTVEAACEAMVEVTDTTAPGEHAASYDKAYAVYRSLYPKLEEAFTDLAEV